MFGFSFGEFMVICVVALVAVGPQKLPSLLRSLGQWARKARMMLTDMRAQSGIDDLLRAEGFHGGLGELRGLMRDQHTPLFSAPAASQVTAPPPPEPSAAPYVDPFNPGVELDPTKEYPPEGPDAYGAVPDDLLDFEDPFRPSAAAPESLPAPTLANDSVPPERSAPAA